MLSALELLLGAKAAPVAPTPAPVAPVAAVVAPNPANVPTREGTPQDTLSAILGEFQAASGSTPRVNPPEAAKVLAGPTTLEVAGHAEPAEVKEVKVAPVEKPAAVVAAENEKRSRRTAAVVQLELDAALAKIALLESIEVGPAEGADPAEVALLIEDNRKAWARVADLEASTKVDRNEMVVRTIEDFETRELVTELFERGFGITRVS